MFYDLSVVFGMLMLLNSFVLNRMQLSIHREDYINGLCAKSWIIFLTQTLFLFIQFLEMQCSLQLFCIFIVYSIILSIFSIFLS